METEYMETNADGEYVGYEEHLVYTDPDWEDPNAHTYVQDGTRPPGGGGGGEIESFTEAGEPAFTVVGRSGSYVTVRTNREITFSGSIPLNGSISGRIPAGAIMRGRDDNRNGIPDILEKQIRKGTIRL